MPLPIVGAAALAAARILAGQVAKQTGKKLTQNQMKAIAIKVASTQKGKVSTVAARRVAEQAAGRKARSLGGNKSLRGISPKPGIKLTTQTSGGGSVKVGPAQPIKVKLTQRAQGPRREFEKLPTRTREVSGEKTPTFGKPKVKVDRNRPNTKKPKTNVTVTKVEPRKRSDVLQERAKVRRERLRNALAPKVNPARPKTRKSQPIDLPKRIPTRAEVESNFREGTYRGKPVKFSPGQAKAIDKNYKRKNARDEVTPQGQTIRGKFYPEGNPGIMPRSRTGQPDIESRLAAGVEKPTRGNVNTTGDKEGSALAQRSIREVGKPSLKTGADFKPNKGASRVKPGVRTNATRLIREIQKAKTPAEKKAKTAELKRVIRNQRKVLKQREFKKDVDRTQLTRAELDKIIKDIP